MLLFFIVSIIAFLVVAMLHDSFWQDPCYWLAGGVMVYGITFILCGIWQICCYNFGIDIRLLDFGIFVISALTGAYIAERILVWRELA